MNNAALMKGRARALLTDFRSLTVIVIAVIVCVYIALYGDAEKEKSIRIQVVNEDAGTLGAHLIELLNEENYEFSVVSREKAVHEVAVNKAQGMIEIAPDFTEKIRKGDYQSLVKVTVMADTYDMTYFTEIVINDIVKVFTETLIEEKLEDAGVMDEAYREEFRSISTGIWNGESLLDIETFAMEEDAADEEVSFYGIRWYAVLTMFYLIISGTWMCDYASTGLLKRVVGCGGRISSLFAVQMFPGLGVTVLGFVPVLIASKHPDPGKVFLSFVIYSCGTAALALVTCSLSGKFANLILSATVITMAASLFSGLICDIPDWAAIWDKVSGFLPGHWYFNAVGGKPFLAGALIVTVFWFAVGVFTSWSLGIKRGNE
ncbi:MAG: ABC transporter permease [Lachnospiraceae bacterium]|nr:ABC transporter permease [Lachnospiraceae bacterium]